MVIVASSVDVGEVGRDAFAESGTGAGTALPGA